MSNPNDLATSFVAMAKAFEELPRVQAQYDSAQDMIEDYAKQVQRLEMAAIDRKAEIEHLNHVIRKVEAERDDAELRFLESEDRTSSALNFIKTTFGSAGSLIQALEPPAPVSVPMPPAEPEVIHIQPGLNPSWASRGQEDVRQEDVGVKVGASEGSPTSYSQTSGGLAKEPTDQQVADATMGQSESNPTAYPIQPVSSAIAGTAETMDGVRMHSNPTEAPAAPTVDPTPIAASSTADTSHTHVGPAEGITPAMPSGPFTNKRYYDHPTYLTLAAWLDGGGTEADYNWRPAPYKSGY